MKFSKVWIAVVAMMVFVPSLAVAQNINRVNRKTNTRIIPLPTMVKQWVGPLPKTGNLDLQFDMRQQLNISPVNQAVTSQQYSIYNGPVEVVKPQYYEAAVYQRIIALRNEQTAQIRQLQTVKGADSDKAIEHIKMNTRAQILQERLSIIENQAPQEKVQGTLQALEQHNRASRQR